MSNAGTPPGWYPDPENPGQNRYWDGAAWSAPSAPSSPEAVAGFAPGPPPGGGSGGGKVAVIIVAIVVLLGAVGGGVWALTSGGGDDDEDDDDEVATDDDGGSSADRDELLSELEEFGLSAEEAECIADGVDDAGLDYDDIPGPDEDPDPDSDLADQLTDIAGECIGVEGGAGDGGEDDDDDGVAAEPGADPDPAGQVAPDFDEAEEVLDTFLNAINDGDVAAATALACNDGTLDFAVENAIDQGWTLFLRDLDEETAVSGEHTGIAHARWRVEGNATGWVSANKTPDTDWCVVTLGVA